MVTRVRNIFPPLISLKQLEDIPQEELCKIPLETVQNVYEPIQKRIVTPLNANAHSAPYL
jgi:hypothetical protein